MKGVAVMNKYFLYYLFTACVAGVFMIFSGINLFLFAGIVAVVGILAAATWSLGDCLADSLQNLMGKPMAPAARFYRRRFLSCRHTRDALRHGSRLPRASAHLLPAGSVHILRVRQGP